MADLSALLGNSHIPAMHLVKQIFPRPRIENLEKELIEALDHVIPPEKVIPGSRIAITAGSRGIASIADIYRVIADYLKGKGANPFIVPAMGSHGGGRPEGQIEILKNLGITEKTVNVPIRASMEAVLLGQTPCGIPVWVNAVADGADWILVVNRIKPHTDVTGPFESGITKMLSVGLGNLKGAAACHSRGLKKMGYILPEVRDMVISKLPVLGGIGILENAYGETAGIYGLKTGEIDSGEKGLLEKARELMGRILISESDLLLVDRMGKDISGAGMDPNVTGRAWDGSHKAGTTFSTKCIVVFDLTEASGGNASGIGTADITTSRLFQKIDFTVTYANAITSRITERLPMILDNDYQALATGLFLAGEKEARIVRIKDTLDLGHIMVSENLWYEVEACSGLDLIRRDVPLLSGMKDELAPFPDR
ncbi:MAG: hypothetical protein PWR02_1256 [Synergistales bacterium]|nr:hypothetical protein [Synergistales bacterium]